ENLQVRACRLSNVFVPIGCKLPQIIGQCRDLSIADLIASALAHDRIITPQSHAQSFDRVVWKGAAEVRHRCRRDMLMAASQEPFGIGAREREKTQTNECPKRPDL